MRTLLSGTLLRGTIPGPTSTQQLIPDNCGVSEGKSRQVHLTPGLHSSSIFWIDIQVFPVCWLGLNFRFFSFIFSSSSRPLASYWLYRLLCGELIKKCTKGKRIILSLTSIRMESAGLLIKSTLCQSCLRAKVDKSKNCIYLMSKIYAILLDTEKQANEKMFLFIFNKFVERTYIQTLSFIYTFEQI